MNVIDEERRDQDTAELDDLANKTGKLSNDLKDRIKSLESAPPGQDAQMRRNRVRSPLMGLWTFADGLGLDCSPSLEVPRVYTELPEG
jgi:hypothetical protein